MALFRTLPALLVLAAITLSGSGCGAETTRLPIGGAEGTSEDVMYARTVGDDTVATERVFRSGTDLNSTVNRATGVVRYVAEADLSGRIVRLEVAWPDFASIARVGGGRPVVSDEIADAARQTEEAPADVAVRIDGWIGLLAGMLPAGRAEGEATRVFPIRDGAPGRLGLHAPLQLARTGFRRAGPARR